MAKRLCYRSGVILGAVLFLSLLPACEWLFRVEGTDPSPIAYPDSCIAYGFDIRELPYEAMPDANYDSSDIIQPLEPVDSAGVVYFKWKGERYYHPVNMCQRALVYLDLFKQTADSSHLHRVEAYINRLVSEAVDFDSALYFPYPFDYNVHKRDDAPLEAPWYSGMAQGQVLSLLIRTYQVTGDSTYLELSERVFLTLTRVRGEYEPWVVFVDSLGCFWIEEYPTSPQPSMTLNGFVFAIYGLYDYYLQTRRDDARSLLERSLGTIKNYIPSYRRSGQASFYGLTFHRYSGRYHMTHIEQLRQLTLMTGDPFFAKWADTLAGDYSE